MTAKAVVLDWRGVLRVDGPERGAFLQGIVSNDVAKAGDARAIWTAFLTPQGKFLHEFFMVEQHGAFLLDCEAARRDDLKRRLGRYKLRAKAGLSDASDDFLVAAAFGEGALAELGLEGGAAGQAIDLAGGKAFVDPRLGALGARLILPRAGALAALTARFGEPAAPQDYDRLRLSLGAPDGSRDLEVEKSTLLENGFEELNGVDWDKGCYLGQEVTARTKYRGLVKKRLLPVAITGPAPAPGTPVMLAAREVGVMRSVVEGRGLALLRLDALASGAAALMAGEARVTPQPPDWLALKGAP